MNQIPNELSLDRIVRILQETFSTLKKDVTYVIAYVGDLAKEKDGIFTFRIFVTEYLWDAGGKWLKQDFAGHTEIFTLPFNLFRLIYPGLLIQNGELLFGSLFRVNGIMPFKKLDQWKGKHGKLRDFIKLRETEPFEIIGNSKVICWDISPIYFGVTHYVILPKSELVRFYFCPSTRLGNTLLMAAAIDDNPQGNLLYNPGSLSPDNQDVKEILIRKAMLVRDVPTIARIAYSSIARAQASLIGKTFLSDTPAQKKNEYFDSSFPFSERPNLVCEFMNLDAERLVGGSVRKVRITLIHKILSCRSLFPFKKLRYTREGDLYRPLDKKQKPKEQFKHDSEAEEEPEDSLEKLQPRFDHDTFFGKNLLLLNTPPRDPKFSRIKANETLERFPNLPKDIRPKEKKLGPKRLPKKEAKRRKFTGKATTNDDTIGDSKIPSVEQTSKDRKTATISKSLEEFMNLLRNEFSEDGCDFFGAGQLENLIIAFKEVPSTLVFSDKGEQFVRTTKGKLRDCIIIPVNRKGKYFLVVELHPRQKGSKNALRIVFKNGFKEINDSEIDLALEALAEGYGSAVQSAIQPFQSIKINHESDNTGDLDPKIHKQRIMAKLNEYWSI